MPTERKCGTLKITEAFHQAGVAGQIRVRRGVRGAREGQSSETFKVGSQSSGSASTTIACAVLEIKKPTHRGRHNFDRKWRQGGKRDAKRKHTASSARFRAGARARTGPNFLLPGAFRFLPVARHRMQAVVNASITVNNVVISML